MNPVHDRHPQARVRAAAVRGLFRAVLPVLIWGAAAGCKENLSPPLPGGTGPDTSGPVLSLTPGRDTTTDSVGTLLVRVTGRDRSIIKSVQFNFLGVSAGFPAVAPFDTTFNVLYPIALGQFKHSTFSYYVRALDLLDHVTVTDTVTITVR